MTNDAHHPAAADAWRQVELGIKLVHAGLLMGMAVPVVSCLCCLPTMVFFSGAMSWLPLAGGILLGCALLSVPVFIITGMAFCCAMPFHSGRRYAVAALTLSLTFAAMVALAVGVGVMDHRRLTWLQWIHALERNRLFPLIAATILLLNFTFAATCWQRFLEALARTLGIGHLESDAQVFRWLLVGWSVAMSGFAFPLLGIPAHESFGIMYYSWFVVFFGVPILYIWQVVLLIQFENHLAMYGGKPMKNG